MLGKQVLWLVILFVPLMSCEEDCEDEGGKCIVPLPDEDGDGCFDDWHPEDLECSGGKICCIPNDE
jgi:hypothetical protein